MVGFYKRWCNVLCEYALEKQKTSLTKVNLANFRSIWRQKKGDGRRFDGSKAMAQDKECFSMKEVIPKAAWDRLNARGWGAEKISGCAPVDGLRGAIRQGITRFEEALTAAAYPKKVRRRDKQLQVRHFGGKSAALG